jgi:hypothetical protein
MSAALGERQVSAVATAKSLTLQEAKGSVQPGSVAYSTSTLARTDRDAGMDAMGEPPILYLQCAKSHDAEKLLPVCYWGYGGARDCNFDFWDAGENVEFGDVEASISVDHGGVYAKIVTWQWDEEWAR